MGRGPDGRSTDIPSGGGVPRWIAAHAQLLLPLRDGAPFARCRRARIATAPCCPACGFIAYVNPRLVVTTIPVTDEGEVVLLRRGIEPGRGCVGAARRLPRGRRDRHRGGDPRDARGDRPARRAGRDRGAVLAARGGGRRPRVRGADRRRRPRGRRRRRSRSGPSGPTRSRGTASPSRRRTGRSATGRCGTRRTCRCPRRSTAGNRPEPELAIKAFAASGELP